MKIKIGITGQQGFVGQHLYNTIGLFSDEFERISFKKAFFDDDVELTEFVNKCDVIVHLAALNRHNESETIYQTNINLVNKLVSALENCGNRPHVLFSSSSQEEKGNPYGDSKKKGREILSFWSKRIGAKFTGMIIPNVYGPFGNPYYNSFIATFCHQLTHGEIPGIEVDSSVHLIYVADLIENMLTEIRNNRGNDLLVIRHTNDYKVSEILKILRRFKTEYFDEGIIPYFNNSFELNLFNTFRSYIDIEKHFPVQFDLHADQRGSFVEIIRLNSGGQVSFSTTLPGVARGNHYHTRKIERFAVIKGEALIQLRKIGSNTIYDIFLEGSKPSYIDIPIWFTHNIKNIGNGELYTNFWINEFYDPKDPDTFMENV